jgi:hypothetical protein
MGITESIAAESATKAVSSPRKAVPPPPGGRPLANKARRHVAVKPKLPTRLDLDGRSNAAKQFDAITDALCVDLGGKAALSAVELRLVESFAGASVLAEAMNVQLLLGQKIDSSEFCSISSTLCKIGSRLGLKRRPQPGATSG